MPKIVGNSFHRSIFFFGNVEYGSKILVDSHVAYVLEMGSELNEPRHGQYMDKLEESIEELENTVLLMGKVGQVKLLDDYEIAKLQMDARIAELLLAGLSSLQMTGETLL